MLIANPIYDAVFKYLLEDLDIAREFLSVILGENIIEIAVKPQESARETADGIRVYRVDFKAVIELPDLTRKTILIELQKSKELFNIMRFRGYLANNYLKQEFTNKVLADGTLEKEPIPIIGIYFLGFPLKNIFAPVVRINRHYTDVATGEILKVKEDFVELLTHDCIIIQIYRLNGLMRNRLEAILELFNQSHIASADNHILDVHTEGDALIQKMLQRLYRASASEEVRNQMELEDEIDNLFSEQNAKLKQQAIEIAEKDRQLNERDRQLNEKDRQLSERDRQLNERDRQLRERDEKLAAEKQKAKMEKLNTARNLKTMGLSTAQICQATGLSADEIQDLSSI
jgi:hypothetical protein